MPNARLETSTMLRLRTPVITRTRLIAVSAAVLILGGVACSAATPNFAARPTPQSSEKAGQSTSASAPVPPALAPAAGGGVAVGAPAAIASDAVAQRSAAAAPSNGSATNSGSTDANASTTVLE